MLERNSIFFESTQFTNRSLVTLVNNFLEDKFKYLSQESCGKKN